MEDIPFPLDDDFVDNPPKIFGDVKYCVAGNVDSKILKILNNGGARLLNYATFSATHMIVGEGADDAEVEDAEDMYEIPSFEARWVVFSAKAGKLLPRHGFEAQLKKLFSQVIFTSIGITGEDLSILWGLLTYHGGRFQKHLTLKTTHLFSHSTESTMYQVAKKHDIKVVCLDWATDSIKAGSLLDEEEYDPQFLIAEVEAAKPAESLAVKQRSASTLVPEASITAVLPTPVPAHEALPNQDDLEVVKSSGSPPAIETKEVAIDGEPQQARPLMISTEKQLVTKSSLSQGNSSPTVPILAKSASPPPPPMKQKPTTSQQNQLAIPEPSAQQRQVSSGQPGQSQKIATIQGTPPKSSGQQRQTVQLNGFFLGCVFWPAQVIDTPSWRHYVLFFGGEVVHDYDPTRVTHVLCRNQKFPEFQQVMRDGKRLVTVYWLSDTCSRKVMAPPFYAVHLTPPFNESCLPLKGQRFSQTGFEGKDRDRVENMVKLLGANYTPYFSKINDVLVAGRSDGEKFTKAREWKTPVVNVQFLNELLLGKTSCVQKHDPEYQLYSTEQPFLLDINLAPDLLAAWNTPIRVDKEVIEKFEAGKRTLQEALDNAERAKRQKILEEEVLQISYFDGLSSRPIDDDKNDEDEDIENWPPPVIMFSGFTKKFTALATEKLGKLGARFTEDVKEATHLVIWEIGTLRLYSALCRVQHIVSAAWVRDSYKARRFVDEQGYTAGVTSFEKYHKVQIPDILKKPDRHVLFKGMTFYLTPGVDVTVRKSLEEMIEAAGGQVDKSQKSMTDVKMKAKKNPRKYLVITTLHDFEYFSEFFCTQPPIRVFTVLFIYTCIAEQKVDLGYVTGIKSSPKVESANSE